jgi:hypothetical protein
LPSHREQQERHHASELLSLAAWCEMLRKSAETRLAERVGFEPLHRVEKEHF